jgi:hypothetical protein
VAKKYVMTNPRNWKKKDVKRLKAKIKRLPVGKSWTMRSPDSPSGARTVVSQYGGTESV